MNTMFTPASLAGLGISFAIGFGVAWQLREPVPTPPPGPVHAASGIGRSVDPASGLSQFGALWSGTGGDQATAPKASMDELWAQYKSAKAPHLVQEEMQAQMRNAALADPAALRKLMQRFDAERDPQARAMLQSVLASLASPEVVAMSTRLAASSDPARRQEAFELLAQLSPDSPEVRNMVLRTLASEQSPAVLSRAVAALTPTVVAAQEAQNVVTQLDSLTRHADPAVRSQSILQLAQWDKSGGLESRLGQALSDQAPQVRQAAVAGIAETGIRSETMKNALLNLVRNPQESREVKDGALHALERFSLNQDEYALYRQARSEIDKHNPH